MTIRNSGPATYGMISLVALLAIGAVGCGHPEEAKGEPQPPSIVKAEVITLNDATAKGEYTVTGTVKSHFNATLSSKVMGRVTSVFVREGDLVTKGQPLIAIDSRELAAAVTMAGANYHASIVGVGSARTAAEMEAKTSQARIIQAQSQVQQAEAALATAEARRDLVLAGPRIQEVAQSHLAVVQAESSLKLARTELDRATKLVNAGAIAQRNLDLAQNRYDLAKAQYDNAIQGENVAREGSRSQEIRAAQEAVSQAKAAVNQAKSGVVSAKAEAMQVAVKKKEVEVATAQVQQASAAVQSAEVSLSYGRVVAPFDGRVVQRMVDPGSMASSGVPLIAIEGGDFRLEAVVPERIMKSLAIGDSAPIQIDALTGRTITGRIVEIVPQGDAVSHSFVVKFSLSPAPGIKSGMFAKARIRTGSVSRLQIPVGSAWEREGLHYVFAVNKEGIARLRIVTLGEPTDGSVEVLSGLSPGDRIVSGNRDAVSDGVKVEAK